MKYQQITPVTVVVAISSLLLLQSPGADVEAQDTSGLKTKPVVKDQSGDSSVTDASKASPVDTTQRLQTPDQESVKRNQAVLNALYENIYRYGSGVLNYDKKVN